jgi:ATP-dependent Clp protease protease subunit
MNRDWKEIEELFVRDRYMHAIEAKKYGLIDEILGNVNDLVTFEDGKLTLPGENGQLE